MKNSLQKGFVAPLLIAVAIVVIGGAIYLISSREKATSTGNNEDPGLISEVSESQINIDHNATIDSTYSRSVKSSMTVVTPNGGEKVIGNKGYIISWKNIDAPLKVNILLEKYSQEGTPIDSITNYIAEAIDNSGSYLWIPSNDLASNVQYKIKITSAGGTNSGAGPVDSSDGYFTVSNSVNSTAPASVIDSNWKKYSNSVLGLSFNYPPLFVVGQSADAINLIHSIAYKHPDPCDMKGDAKPLERLTDLAVSIKIVDQDLKAFVQSSSYPGWDYVSKNPFTLGSLSGYKITEGVEGCGKDVYYFTLSPTKTLIIDDMLITEFSSIIRDYQTYLNLPGIITPSQKQEMFTKILSTFKFTVTGAISKPTLIKKLFNGFTVGYPNSWKILSQDQYPNYSITAFTTDSNSRVSVLSTGDQTQIGAILAGPVVGGIDSSKTKKTEFTERGLHVIRWDYVFVGDSGFGAKNRSVWVVLRSCNIDTVYVIDDQTLFNNFSLVDVNGNESGSAKFSLCSI